MMIVIDDDNNNSNNNNNNNNNSKSNKEEKQEDRDEDDDEGEQENTSPPSLHDDKDVKQDIDMIINELVRPLLPHVILYVLKRKVPYLEFFSPLMNINSMIDEGIDDGLRYARHILYNEKRAKLIKVINYLIKKYNTK